ncbi:MAG: hypothetical protein LBS21_11570 [Clostridiales bacterium]|jgi:hypothetical protein|nr:hypothetical protein [Clostridiales bacterium]
MSRKYYITAFLMTFILSPLVLTIAILANTMILPALGQLLDQIEPLSNLLNTMPEIYAIIFSLILEICLVLACINPHIN